MQFADASAIKTILEMTSKKSGELHHLIFGSNKTNVCISASMG